MKIKSLLISSLILLSGSAITAVNFNDWNKKQIEERVNLREANNGIIDISEISSVRHEIIYSTGGKRNVRAIIETESQDTTPLALSGARAQIISAPTGFSPESSPSVLTENGWPYGFVNKGINENGKYETQMYRVWKPVETNGLTSDELINEENINKMELNWFFTTEGQSEVGPFTSSSSNTTFQYLIEPQQIESNDITLSHLAQNDNSSTDVVIHYSVDLSDYTDDGIHTNTSIINLELLDNGTVLSDVTYPPKTSIHYPAEGDILITNLSSDSSHEFELNVSTDAGGSSEKIKSPSLIVNRSYIQDDDLIDFSVNKVDDEMAEVNYNIEIETPELNINPEIDEFTLSWESAISGDSGNVTFNPVNDPTYDSSIGLLTYSGTVSGNYSSRLIPGESYVFTLSANTSTSENVVFTNTTTFDVPKLAPDAIDESNITKFAIAEETATTLTYDYSITLPSDPKYEATTIESIELIGADDKVYDTATSETGQLTATGLEANTNYSFTIKVTTNALESDGSQNVVEITASGTTTQFPPEIITEDNIEITNPNIGETFADINYYINLNNEIDNNDNGDKYEDTEVTKVELLDSDDNVLDTIEDKNVSGNFSVTGLTPGTKYTYKLRVTTNAIDGSTPNVVTKTFNFTTELGAPRPIENGDVTASLLENTSDTAKINYDITLPPHDDDFNDTEVTKVELLDESNNSIQENIDGSTSGTFDISGLDPNTSYTYKIKVTTNALESDGSTPNEIIVNVNEFTTDLGSPQDLLKDNIDLTNDATKSTSDSLTYNYDITLPSDADYEPTEISEVKLISESDDVVATNSGSETSGDLIATGLDPNKEYNFKIEVVTNANTIATNLVSGTTIKGDPLEPISITAFDENVMEKSADIKYTIELPTDGDYNETTINSVELLDESNNQIQENTDGLSTGIFNLTGLEGFTTYSYKVKVNTNGGSKETSLQSFNTTKKPALPIDETNIILSESDVKKDSIKINYDIDLPSNVANYETMITKVELLDESNNSIQENIDGSTSGTFDISGLDPNTPYTYGVRVTTNALESDGTTINSVIKSDEFTTDLDDPLDLPKENIILENVDQSANTLTYHYDIELPNDENHKPTEISEVKLISESDDVVATNSGSETSGDLIAIGLDPNKEYNFKVEVVTNANTIATDLVLGRTDAVQLVIDEVGGFVYSDDDSILEFNANIIQGDTDDFKLRYEETVLNLTFIDSSRILFSGVARYELEVPSNADLSKENIDKIKNVSYSLNGGAIWTNITFETLTNGTFNLDSSEGISVNDGGIIKINGEDSIYKIVEEDGIIKVIDTTSRFPWWIIVVIILLLLILLIILIILLLKKGWKAVSINNLNGNKLMFVVNKKPEKAEEIFNDSKLFLVADDREELKVKSKVENNELIWEISKLPLVTSKYKFELERSNGKIIKVKAKVKLDKEKEPKQNKQQNKPKKSKNSDQEEQGKKTKSDVKIFY